MNKSVPQVCPWPGTRTLPRHALTRAAGKEAEAVLLSSPRAGPWSQQLQPEPRPGHPEAPGGKGLSPSLPVT